MLELVFRRQVINGLLAIENMGQTDRKTGTLKCQLHEQKIIPVVIRGQHMAGSIHWSRTGAGEMVLSCSGAPLSIRLSRQLSMTIGGSSLALSALELTSNVETCDRSCFASFSFFWPSSLSRLLPPLHLFIAPERVGRMSRSARRANGPECAPKTSSKSPRPHSTRKTTASL